MKFVAASIQRLRVEHGLNNLSLSERLNLAPGLMSRIASGQKGVSYGLMGRMLINLDASEARALLQAYFDDELLRIKTVRDEKAAELGIPVADPGWPHTVKVGKESSPRAKG